MRGILTWRMVPWRGRGTEARRQGFGEHMGCVWFMVWVFGVVPVFVFSGALLEMVRHRPTCGAGT